MILRRIKAQIEKENWFAVGVDFLIVVVGVFIGIQVANWSDARANEQLGRDYIVRLTSDLQQDLTAHQALLDYYANVLDSVQEADRLMNTANPDAQALVVAAYRASEYTSNPNNRATWEQVVSSGHLGLLPDTAIEFGISDYYKFQDGNDLVSNLLLESPYRLAVRSKIPLSIQLSIREGCSDVLDEIYVASGFVAECHLNIDEAVLEEAAEKLRSSRLVAETLRYQYSMIAAVQINNEGNIALLKRVLDALAAKRDEE